MIGSVQNRTRAVAWLIAALSCAFCALPSDSAATQFAITNDAGRPQTGVEVRVNGVRAPERSDATGQITLDVAAGDELLFRRRAALCPGPEGDGVRYTVPSPTPASAGVLLPTIIDTWGVGSEHSGPERHFVALLNAERAERGLQLVQLSRPLSEIAYFAADSRAGAAAGECGHENIITLLSDASWPFWSASETFISWRPRQGAEVTYSELRETDPEMLFSPSARTIGLADHRSYWQLLLGQECLLEACGLTGDYGAWPDDPDADPRLTLLNARRSGRFLDLRYRVRSLARGRLELTTLAQEGRYYSRKVDAGRARLRVRSPRRGRLRLFARFVSDTGSETQVCNALRVPRARSEKPARFSERRC